MTLLITAAASFILIHLGIAGGPLRSKLRSVLGNNGYLGAFSLLTIISLGAMIYAYGLVPHNDFVWLPNLVAVKVTKVILLFAFLFLVLGSMTRNPTAVKMEDAVNHELAGAVKITRHPIQWGILLFASGHLIANGDKASIVFFGTFALVSFAGMFSMDQRKRQEPGEAWQKFFATTSMLPFAALAAGRTKLQPGDMNWLAIIVALALYASVYWFHDLVSGGSSLF